MVTVHKFGGGVLRNLEDFARVASLLKGTGHVAVVSAAYDVTDALDLAARESLGSDDSIDRFTHQLAQQHIRVLEPIQNTTAKKEALQKILRAASQLNKIFYGVFFIRELTPRTRDLVHSYGERLSAIVLEAHLLERGVHARAFNADEAGLVTTPDFCNALPLMEKTTENLAKNVLPFAQEGVAVFTGYFGVSEEGNVTTFGRGGSDFSAGIVASALNADKLMVWKDVEGFMTADPKIVPSARLIPLLSYDEAEELGYFGAKILYPRTITPVREKQIPVFIKNVFTPEKDGTVISVAASKTDSAAKSVAVKKDACIVALKGASLLDVSSVAYPLFSQLRDSNLPIDSISTSQSDLSLCFEHRLLPDFLKALNHTNVPREQLIVEEDASLLGLIGAGMRQSIGVSGRLFSCLGRAGVNVRMISQGASEINITVAIARSDVEKALNAVHSELIG